MPFPTPRWITLARWTAAGQVLIATLLATLFTTLTIAWTVADRAAAGTGRPVARTALIAGELITLPLAALLVLTTTRTVWGAVLGVFVALGITTLVALLGGAARSWARGEPPCTARIPSDCAQA